MIQIDKTAGLITATVLTALTGLMVSDQLILARPHPAPRRRRKQYGFTMLEMLIYMVVAGIVMAAVYQLLIGQGRSYGKQRELMDVHETLRSAAALLAWEMRWASAADGDIYAIGANSITLRSVQGSGIVCAQHATLPRLGIRGEPGEMAATTDDSALIFVAGATGLNDDLWNVLSITAVNTPAALGVGACAWTASGTPDVAVEIAVTAPSDTAGLAVGAPFRAFWRVEYGIYQEDGRWWLGRKVGAAATYEKLTGPLLSQVSGGLVFSYSDSNGATTTDPSQVAMVSFILRAESYRQLQGSGNHQADTVATRVALRG